MKNKIKNANKNKEEVKIIPEPNWMIILKKLIEQKKLVVNKNEQLNLMGGEK